MANSSFFAHDPGSGNFASSFKVSEELRTFLSGDLSLTGWLLIKNDVLRMTKIEFSETVSKLMCGVDEKLAKQRLSDLRYGLIYRVFNRFCLSPGKIKSRKKTALLVDDIFDIATF